MPAPSIDIVPVESLHERLGFEGRLEYPLASRQKRFTDWKMEIDDAPILRYMYRHARPHRHLEFGTWEGAGACYCLEECDASVWTINLPDGERVDGLPVYASVAPAAPDGAAAIGEQSGAPVYQTDSGPFIGHRYRSAGFGHRVSQILCDSREWNETDYAGDFFDTALIDGGHTAAVVVSDTRKALSVVRSGGLILWHDFCPDPSVFSSMSSVSGVITGLTSEWQTIGGSLSDVFWIQPSFLLVGVRR